MQFGESIEAAEPHHVLLVGIPFLSAWTPVPESISVDVSRQDPDNIYLTLLSSVMYNICIFPPAVNAYAAAQIGKCAVLIWSINWWSNGVFIVLLIALVSRLL